MGWFRKRMAEPSSFAGFGLLISSMTQLIVNPADLFAWGELFGGISAIIKSEAGHG